MSKKRSDRRQNVATTAAPGIATNSTTVVQNGATLQNGLAEAIGFNGVPQYARGTQQISQATTIFDNLRFYLVSNFRQILSQAYVEIGLIQTLVNVPVDDGFRGGVELKSKQLDEDQLQELQIALDREGDLLTAAQAVKWNRLFGGAGLMILTDQDPEEELDVDAIGPGDKLDFRAVDMWELTGNVQNLDDIGLPVGSKEFTHYDYYGVKVHVSRVMRLTGIAAPSFVRPRLRGWGFSVVEVLVRSINQYLKATDLGFEVLDEFKLDIYKIKNLTNTLMSPIGSQKIQERVQMANWQKNYQNAVVMDAEDDFDHKQLSFSGLGDAMAGIRMQVASDVRMPLTKLFGISAAGFNSGEDDIENYNAMVESEIRSKIKYDILRICELRSQQLFGFVPDDLAVSFKPLRVLSSDQEEGVKTQKFNRLLQARQAGEISTAEFRDGCNKSNVFDITLDTSDDVVSDIEDKADEKDAVDDEEPKAGGKTPGGKDAPKAPQAKTKNTKWDESKHPRADDGKFGEGGGKGKAGKSKPAIKRDALISESDAPKLIAEHRDTFEAIGAENPDLAESVYHWSRDGYSLVRRLQAGVKPDSLDFPEDVERAKKTTAILDAEFSALPAYDGPVVRDIPLKEDKALSLFKAGETFTLDAYTSFTAKEAFHSARNVRIVVGSNKTGKAVWGLSQEPLEMEVLVQKGTRYKIDKVVKRSTFPKVVVYVSEVESGSK